MNDSEGLGYSVSLRSRRAARELDRLSDSDAERVIAALRRLGENPRMQGAVKIGDDIYRLRVGRYRVIYKIDDAARAVFNRRRASAQRRHIPKPEPLILTTKRNRGALTRRGHPQ